MPSCPRCGSTMTSGEECRLFEDTGWSFSCWPHAEHSLLDYLMGTDVEEEDV